MGLSSTGDAQSLLEAVQPEVLVLTPLAPSFSNDLSFLGTVEREIAWLARDVDRRGGRIVACTDDPRIAAVVAGLSGVVPFGRHQIRQDAEGSVLAIGDALYPVGLDAVGESALYALVAGAEVARILGIEESRIRTFLAGGRIAKTV
jgi:hypothetical protein